MAGVASDRIPTVFVVDDERCVRAALSRLLDAAGRRVMTAESAAELLPMLEVDQPGCLILDIELPEIDGIELAHLLYAVGCRMPVIFISGAADATTRLRRVNLAPTAFLAKPFTDLDLLGAVDKALALDSVAGELRSADPSSREDANTLLQSAHRGLAINWAEHLRHRAWLRKLAEERARRLSLRADGSDLWTVLCERINTAVQEARAEGTPATEVLRLVGTLIEGSGLPAVERVALQAAIRGVVDADFAA